MPFVLSLQVCIVVIATVSRMGHLIVNARYCTADSTLEKRRVILCPVAWTDIRAAVRTASRSPRSSFASPRSLHSKQYNCNSHRFRQVSAKSIASSVGKWYICTGIRKATTDSCRCTRRKHNPSSNSQPFLLPRPTTAFCTKVTAMKTLLGLAGNINRFCCIHRPNLPIIMPCRHGRCDDCCG
jgi:hypothetical protein